jgi:hypothetical protein
MTDSRFSVATLIERLQPLVGTVQHVPKTTNKGAAGLALETLLGIPHSPACLDCTDGELKAFPLKRLKSGALVPKETVAITMVCPENLRNQPFAESRCRKKLERTLFVPYLWESNGDLRLFAPVLFSAETHAGLFAALEADYAELQRGALEGRLTGSIGVYLQTRTKGAGHGSTSRAFYVRPSFLRLLFPEL